MLQNSATELKKHQVLEQDRQQTGQFLCFFFGSQRCEEVTLHVLELMRNIGSVSHGWVL